MKKLFLLGALITSSVAIFSFSNVKEERCSVRQIEEQMRLGGCQGGQNVCCVSTVLKHM